MRRVLIGLALTIGGCHHVVPAMRTAAPQKFYVAAGCDTFSLRLVGWPPGSRFIVGLDATNMGQSFDAGGSWSFPVRTMQADVFDNYPAYGWSLIVNGENVGHGESPDCGLAVTTTTG